MHSRPRSLVALVGHTISHKISPMRDWQLTHATEVLPSSKSCDIKTRKDIKTPAWSNSETVLELKNQQSFARSHWKWRTRDFENGRISNFQCHMTLTLDRVIWHTVVHHTLTSTYTPTFIRIGETVCGWMDRRMYVQICMYRQTSRTALLGQLGGVDLTRLHTSFSALSFWWQEEHPTCMKYCHNNSHVMLLLLLMMMMTTMMILILIII